MKILYVHGIHAAPGPKVERLQQMKERPRVFVPVLHDHQLLRRLDQPGFLQIVERAQSACNLFRPDLIVACSFGGAVALRLNCPQAKLLLLSPFWRRSARAIVASLPIVRRISRIALGVRFVWRLSSDYHAPPGSVVLHCPLDQMVPIAHSRQLLAQSDLPPENLVAVTYNGDAALHRRGFDAHRMNFANALDQLEFWARRLTSADRDGFDGPCGLAVDRILGPCLKNAELMEGSPGTRIEATMTPKQRQGRWLEVWQQLQDIREGKVVGGDPAVTEARLLEELEGLEWEAGREDFRNRGR